MAQFSNYSWNNQILIAFQRPAASTGQVAGFHTWRKLGRHVKKGAKGIAILAPCVYRKTVDETKQDSTTIKSVHGFRTVYVFCEEDTEGHHFRPSRTVLTLAVKNYSAASNGSPMKI